MKSFAIKYLLVAMFPVLPGSLPDVRPVLWAAYQDCDDARKEWLKVPGVIILIDCIPSNGTERIVILPEAPNGR